MDYEKLHKDTIAKLQEMVNNGKITVETACGICADFVPESEDERIRKELLQIVKENEDSFYMTMTPGKRKHLIAWLEKQGEFSDKIHYWTEEEIEPIISDYLRGAEHYGGMIGRLRCLRPKSLEKQCEQMSDKVEPKFHEGEWITIKE